MLFSLTHRPTRVAATVAFAIGLMATSAWAAPFHLHLIKSSPLANATVAAAPDSIRLSFSETPELKVTTVKVTGPGNASVALAPLASADSATVVAAVKGKMSPGTYTVAWRTMARDGHVARGNFAFTVAPSKR
ncbi:MAG TPA: copper resistance CopC family protein [Gemmatimonadaceae bacterium]|nr:copper resistance CopC family protein [Gemmatimonadaceae bacterium]